MARSKGFKRKTRSLLTRPVGARSGPRPDIYLMEYKPGDKVLIILDPSVHKGMPHRRYHGKVGTIIEKRGRGYVVRVMQGDKPKEVAVLPDHLRPLVNQHG